MLRQFLHQDGPVQSLLTVDFSSFDSYREHLARSLGQYSAIHADSSIIFGTADEKVMDLHEQGISNRQIALRLGMARLTVAKYIDSSSCPMYPEGRTRTSKLDPYLPYLHERWESGFRNASQLWREIRTLEFSGSRGLVAIWAAKQRQKVGGQPVRPPAQPRPYQRPLTPSRAVWFFLKTQDNLTYPQYEVQLE